ncbi:MAG: keto-deoxy-phosphogluconate aldolase, partial [Pseudomonadales bacterium]
LSGPFPDIRFIPSGGVGADDASAYLALDNVLAVSGSWMAPRSLIEREAWSSIESLARDASLGIRERNSSN